MKYPRHVSINRLFGWLFVVILVAGFTLAPAQVGRGRSRMEAVAPTALRRVGQPTAYSHLFQIVCPSGVHEPETLAARQASFGRHLRLDEEQTAILIDVASEYRTFVAELQNRARSIAGPAEPIRERSQHEKEQLQTLNASRRQFLSTLISELHERLDNQGDQLVRDHVNDKMIPNIQIRSTAQ